MLNDPTITTQQFAMAAPAPEQIEPSGFQTSVTEQFLLGMFRFVQYATEKSSVTEVERILLDQSKDILDQLADLCEIKTATPEPVLRSADLAEIELDPLTGNFELKNGSYQEQSLASVGEVTPLAAAETSVKKAKKKKAAGKKSRRRKKKSS